MDRQPPGLTAYDNLFTNVGAFLPALANLYIVGSKIIDEILAEWDTKFYDGIKGKNSSAALRFPVLMIHSNKLPR